MTQGGFTTPTMENQMDRKIDYEMEAGIIERLRGRKEEFCMAVSTLNLGNYGTAVY